MLRRSYGERPSFSARISADPTTTPSAMMSFEVESLYRGQRGQYQEQSNGGVTIHDVEVMVMVMVMLSVELISSFYCS